MKLLSSFLGVLVTSSLASGQSFNVAIGPTDQQPSATYAAAGLAGYWNALPADNNSTTLNLRSIDGAVTNISMWQYGGTELRHTNDPGTSGDDEKLMDYCLVTYTPGVETCLFFYGLQLGDYEVLTYAWMPAAPTVMSYTSSDEEPGNPHRIIGGAWPGAQQETITFSRIICKLTPSDGTLKVHSGIVPGNNAALGAACNGIQIRALPPRTPGDMNCDGVVTAADIPGFAQALISPAAYYSAHPSCRIDNADVNSDGQRTPADVPQFVAMLLAS